MNKQILSIAFAGTLFASSALATETPPAGAGAPGVGAQETGTFKATLTDFTPPSPCVLGHGDRVSYTIRYEINAEGDYLIFTQPRRKNAAPHQTW